MRYPQLILEAYVVYCFIVVLVDNYGGAEKAGRMIQDCSDIAFICYICKKETPKNYQFDSSIFILFDQ